MVLYVKLAKRAACSCRAISITTRPSARSGACRPSRSAKPRPRPHARRSRSSWSARGPSSRSSTTSCASQAQEGAGVLRLTSTGSVGFGGATSAPAACSAARRAASNSLPAFQRQLSVVRDDQAGEKAELRVLHHPVEAPGGGELVARLVVVVGRRRRRSARRPSRRDGR